jgi:hypothetical protein
MGRQVLVCPVSGCRKGKDGGPYKGPLGDLAKHVAMSRDLPHYAWKKERGIPECPLPNEPGWKREAQRIIRPLVWLELAHSFADPVTATRQQK